MLRQMRVILTTAAFIAWPVCLVSQTRAADSVAIVELVHKHVESMRALRADLQGAIYAPDAVWINAFGRKIIGRDSIVAFLRGLYADSGYAGSRIVREMPAEIRFVRSDVATVHEFHEREGQRMAEGNVISRRTHTTFVVSKETGQWLIRYQHISDERERATPVVRADANDNRRAAGKLRDGVLSVALEVRQATWYPDGDQLPGTSVEAFGEVGGNPSVPGPLLRMPAGTEIRGSLRNSLPRDTITFYIPARLSRSAPPDQLDSIVVPPGDVRPLQLSSMLPGTYLYRAVSGRKGTGRAVLHIDGLLGGALVVDSARMTGAPRDRVMVMQGLGDPTEAPALPRVMAINGRSWPHTERMLATVGDTIRWRVINASPEFHPMHLHGFYYRVNAFDTEAANREDAPSSLGQMVVTQRMPPASTMALSWVPERAGNWLFHCHFQRHILPHQPLSEINSSSPAAAHDHLADHALTSMNGLVMGIVVTDKAASLRRSSATSPVKRRHLRLVAVRDTSFPDSLPSMRFVLEERGSTPVDAGPGFSPPIVLFRGEPVSIMVVNHLTEPTAVHWHGIELESYFDGVPGFSGAGQRLAPIVAPHDSFEVLMTPPRSGTFIYHSHVDEPRQQRAGLAGPLIVRDRTDKNTRDDFVFFIKSARAGSLDGPEFEINGKPNPDTLVLKAGRQYRMRLIGLHVSNPNAAVTLTARADSVIGNPRDTLLVQWRPLAKDAIELPQAEQTLRSAGQVVTMGETYDFLFTPTKPEQLRMEVRVSVPRPRLMVRLPIRVE